VFRPRGVGRPPYPFKPMLCALLLIPLGRAESEADLAAQLRDNPGLAEACGFRGGTPSQPTINRWKHRLGPYLGGVFNRLVKALRRDRVIEGVSVAVDATPLEAHPSDQDARWGRIKAEEAFYGYKVSLLTDCGAELPVAVELTRANVHENRVFKPLLRRAGRHVKPRGLCADAIHDNAETRRFVRRIGARAFIDHNPRNTGKMWPRSKVYRRMKASVERVFSRAKELLHLDRVRVRGAWPVTIHVHLVFIAMLLVAKAAVGNDMEESIRCIKTAFR